MAKTLARSLLLMGRRELVADEGKLYGYNAKTGLFEEIPDWQLSRMVQHYAGTPVGPNRVLHVGAACVSGATKLLHDNTAHPEFFAEAPVGISFADGFCVVGEKGIELVPHSPDHRARYACAFPLPRAEEKPEGFLRFLDDIFLGDVDRVQKIAVLQEFLGACLVGAATTYERAILLLGTGDNGKTRLANVLAAVMATGTVTGLAPHLWGDQYQLPRLVGSRLNVVPDLTEDELTSAFKGVISGERMAAREVGQRSFCFNPRAGHLFGANFLPPTRDTSAGFERRWIIIQLNRSFTSDTARDPLVIERFLDTEVPRIVRWGLEGAVRLIRNKEYTLPPSHHIALDCHRSGSWDPPFAATWDTGSKSA